MTDYMHHIDGRLRVRCPALKRNRIEANVVGAHLRARHGVESAHVNHLTGGVLIRYDAALTNADEILQVLAAMGCLDAPARANESIDGASQRKVSQTGKAVAGALLNSLLESLVQRSAARLISALA